MPLVSDVQSKPVLHSNLQALGFWMSVQGRTAEKAEGRLKPYVGDNQGSIQRARVLLVGPMADTDAEQFRKEAEECHLLAEKATSTLDKDEWLRLAAGWTKLAQEAESRGGRWFRT
jgi:hypothetical protein